MTEVLLSGIQALVKACLIQKERDESRGLKTAGYVTGYRGSPLGAVDQEFTKAKNELNLNEILFKESLNEDLAATALWGTQQSNLHGEGTHLGIYGLWYGKGPGVDRSGDALRHANLAGTDNYGGVVMAMGDDHTGESSTTLHQSDYGLMDAMIPIFSPSGVQEILDYSIFGWALSRYSGVWSGLKCVKDTVEIREIVDTAAERVVIETDLNSRYKENLGIRLVDNPVDQEERLHKKKLPAVKLFVRENKIDKTFFFNNKARIGILSAGKNWLDLLSALDILGLDKKRCEGLGITCYKAGVIWPLEDSNLKRWAQNLDLIIVIEEKRKLLEDQVKSILFNETSHAKVIGGKDQNGETLFQSSYALNPVQIARALTRQVNQVNNSEVISAQLTNSTCSPNSKKNSTFDPRKPYFCAGCPHNRSTVIPEGSRAYAGIGCHYMVQWMDRSTVGYTQMGGEGANWIGESSFSKRDHIFQNIGDGTYNHSGLMAIRAAVASEVNITYKILFNDAVAMTGGQKNDGGLDPLKIIKELQAFGVEKVIGIYDPKELLDLKEYKKFVEIKPRHLLLEAQKKLEKIKGVTAIVYIQTCAAEKRRRRKRGEFPDPKDRIFINSEVCEGCGDCGVQSNCVAILPLETVLGRKRIVDQSSCNKDFSCADGFCPSFVTIEDGRISSNAEESSLSTNIPEPNKSSVKNAHGSYNIVLTGIGGTGVVTIGTLLAAAAKEENKYVGIMEMAGLAQKGGEVHVHCKISDKKSKISAIRVPEGQADAIIGGDLLVTASEKALNLLSKNRTKVVCNTNELLTGDFTRDPSLKLNTELMSVSIEARAHKESVWFLDSTRAAKIFLGDSIFSNIILLGFAFQAGLIPLKLSSMEAALKGKNSNYADNLRAFNVGRNLHYNESPISNIKTLELDKVPKIATKFEIEFGARKKRLYEFGGQSLVQKYENKVEKALKLDLELGSAVMEGYFKALYRKDEYEVSRLHLTHLKPALLKSFSGYKKVKFHLAPPLLNLFNKGTRPKKYVFGEWVLVIFKLLVILRPLRDTKFDLFGLSKERRLEKKILGLYEKDLAFIFQNFCSEKKNILIDLAKNPSNIKGFGFIKEKAMNEVLNNRLSLLSEYQ